jgi:hypothetical protein
MNLLLANKQLIVLILGSLTPLVSYVLNHVGPWVSESVKGFVQVLVAAVVGALFTALDTNVFGWNDPTIQLVLTAVVGALAAHHWLWKPAKVNEKLGAVEATVPGE